MDISHDTVLFLCACEYLNMHYCHHCTFDKSKGAPISFILHPLEYSNQCHLFCVDLHFFLSLQHDSHIWYYLILLSQSLYSEQTWHNTSHWLKIFYTSECPCGGRTQTSEHVLQECPASAGLLNLAMRSTSDSEVTQLMLKPG